MFEKLPSLLGFQPRFYASGPARHYLAFLYDVVALCRPRNSVVLGFGDGQVHFTLCQAAREEKIECRCLTIRRPVRGESAEEDEAWRSAIGETEEFYHDVSTLRAQASTEAAVEYKDGTVDFLLLDDSDSADVLREEFRVWEPKLAPHALVLVHGLLLERENPPRIFWEELRGGRTSREFGDGIGLGVVRLTADASPKNWFLALLFGTPEQQRDLTTLYRVVAARIEVQRRVAVAERENSALQLRQVWLDTVLTDRWKAQEIMDDQLGQLSALRAHAGRAQSVMEDQKEQITGLRDLLDERVRELEAKVRDFDELRRDRGKAQVIMDAQAEQLRHADDARREEVEKLRTELAAKKRLIKSAKEVCRKNGRCFQAPLEAKDKPRRSIPEKIIRELKRIPVNLSGKNRKSATKIEIKSSAKIVVDRYAKWIAEHEPSAADLQAQSAQATRLTSRPKISLLLPTHDTPRNFLEELFASLAAQTYDNFEICAVDAASSRAETIECLKAWQQKEPRLQLEFLRENFGIAENTNRALAHATGDFIVCIDHDDMLAPFALYELARAMAANPAAEIFYSDEDRLGTDGKRHSPFFKPEWNPELLLSFMYLGHLTAYRRDLVERVGKFRKEFDFSQDYDFALRATEQARVIVHVPHVLYHWREHPGSGSAGGKPDARKSNLAALGDAMQRRGLEAEIMEYPAANRARLKISTWPKVSIVVPTDSAARGKACVEELPRMSSYPDLEIVVVTNSLLVEALESLTSSQSNVRLVRYDKPFNFSEKCNLGAQAASGTRLIFLNDDVAGTEPDWIQDLIEPLENPQIGGVAPKLLYANGKIQHAGLVTGVRELVGTACHQWPGDSTDYFNFAQSMRDVAALSGACLAMRREDFFAVGKFDEINTPVAHSDFDLCFKIRAAGMRCVYTPFVTMTHRGHESIGAEDDRKKIARAERPSIFLLKRWPAYATRDPYFPGNMRDWLYADSPTPIRMFVPNEYKSDDSKSDLLFVSHDLSLSGAPMMLFHAARWCRDHGDFVVVMSPSAGPLGEKYEAAGIPLIIDPLVEKEHESFARFAREFQCVIANTVFSAPAVRVLKGENVPTAFWLHEPASVGEHFMRTDAVLRAALPQADVLLAPSAWTAAVYQPFSDRAVKCLRNAIPDFRSEKTSHDDAATGPLRFLLLGSVEPRKGQDVFLEAIASLPRAMQEAARFQTAGRILDRDFSRRLEARMATLQNFSTQGAVDHAQALALLGEADVVVSASRDEAMPTVTVLEAMCLGKAIIATAVGGAQEMMANEDNALLVRPEDPAALAAAMRRLMENRALVRQLGQRARATYERNFTIDRLGQEFRQVIAETIALRG